MIRRLIILLLIVGCATEPEDACGVVGGDGTTCADCAGVPNGLSYLDECGGCDANVNNDCTQDECGNWGGDGVDADSDNICDDVDDCIVQDGVSQECGCNTGFASGKCDCAGNTLDCLNVCGGTAVEDDCGVCSGDNSSCLCDGLTEVELWGETYDIGTTDTLYLVYQELTDSIPPEMGCLTNLEYLNLGDNQLTGEIPSEIGNLTNLIVLGLYDNQLTGSIPPEIGNLTNLTQLYLNSNQLSGSIPPEIGNLTNLTYLSLSHNELTGSIPPEIGNLTNLTHLYLGDNQLTNLPESIGNLSSLYWLGLNGNQLTTLPESIGNLSSPVRLWLYDNQLTSLPESIGNLSSFVRLCLNNNQLTTLPEILCNLSIELGVSGGGASGPICNTFENNYICPPYPDCFCPSVLESGQECELYISNKLGEQDTSECEYCIENPTHPLCN